MDLVVWMMEEPLAAALVTRLGVGVVKVVRGRPWWAVMGFMPSILTLRFVRISPRFVFTLNLGCRMFEDETNRCDWSELGGMRFDRFYQAAGGVWGTAHLRDRGLPGLPTYIYTDELVRSLLIK